MTTNGAVTDFLGQNLLGQQGQAAQTTNPGQLTQQGLFDAIMKTLPDIVKIVQNVVAGQSVGGQSLGGQSAGGQSVVGQPGQAGQAGQAGQFDPQFLGFIAPFIPTIISVVGGLLSGQSAGGQSVGGQQFGGQQLGGQSAVGQQQGQGGQLDQQGIFDIIMKSLPVILNTVQTVLTSQSTGGQQFGGQQLGGASVKQT